MRNWFRDGFYVGLSVALLVTIYLMWLWQPERQIRRHTANLFHALEQKNWTRVTNFIADDYRDQWGDDRAILLERTRELFRYLTNVKLMATEITIQTDDRSAMWEGKVTIDGDPGEAMMLLKERVNSTKTPFQLRWRRLSRKPWDWKLIEVRNGDLTIPDYAE
jgi:hypothetical protein